MKESFYHKPYGKAKLFGEKVDKTDLGKLAKLVKIVGLLLQTKVYLFGSAREVLCREYKLLCELLTYYTVRLP